ncbi:MAG: DNA-3-methyladenine glycosylase I, partial [Nitrososphaerales archaeon]
MVSRCEWSTNDPLYLQYHDEEWGVPKHDDRQLFELLTLEGAQAGLSWITILRKRENYRKAFDNFEVKQIAKYNGSKVRKLLSDRGIVRNRLKITAAIQNARSFIAIQNEFNSFDEYIWKFVGSKQKGNSWKSMKEIPSKTIESDEMSK